MISLFPSQEIGPENPMLFWANVDEDARLQDADAIDYSIHYDDGSTLTEIVAETSLDLEANRLGLGRYAIPWTVPADAEAGLYRLTVSWEYDGVTKQAFSEFEVTGADRGLKEPHYCGIIDLRNEGVADTWISDARAAKLIELASRFIEQNTGRIFEPKYMQQKVDIYRGSIIRVGDPIIGVEEIDSEVEFMGHRTETPLDFELIEIYARHLTRGMLNPDDRWDPKIWIAGKVPNASQKIIVKGLFGHTDPDGTPFGKTPEEIERLCVQLVVRFADSVGDGDRDQVKAPFVLSEKTSEQSVSFDPRVVGSGPTGDKDIDDVLIRYRRPFQMGVA